MVSTHPLISKSSRPFLNLLVMVPKAPITIGKNVTFMFHRFLIPIKGEVFIILFYFFQFSSLLRRDSKVHNLASSFFLPIIIMSDCLAEIKWSDLMSKSQRSKRVSFSRIDVGLCIYHLFVWSNLNFLHNSLWITLPTQVCLILYSFCSNLLHSLIIWLIVSSLSWHNLHLLFCYILSILALI